MPAMLIAVVLAAVLTESAHAQQPTQPTAVPGVLWMYPDGTHLFIPSTVQRVPPAPRADYAYYPQNYYPQNYYYPQQAYYTPAYYGQQAGACGPGGCGPSGGRFFGRRWR